MYNNLTTTDWSDELNLLMDLMIDLMVLSTKVMNCDEHGLVYDAFHEIDFVV